MAVRSQKNTIISFESILEKAKNLTQEEKLKLIKILESEIDTIDEPEINEAIEYSLSNDNPNDNLPLKNYISSLK